MRTDGLWNFCWERDRERVRERESTSSPLPCCSQPATGAAAAVISVFVWVWLYICVCVNGQERGATLAPPDASIRRQHAVGCRLRIRSAQLFPTAATLSPLFSTPVCTAWFQTCLWGRRIVLLSNGLRSPSLFSFLTPYLLDFPSTLKTC